MTKALVSVTGLDTTGIIARVATRLYEMNINILDITQTILDGCFTMLMIVDLVRSYGLDVCGDTKPGKICAVSALEYIYDKYGYHVLDKAICLLLATWEGEKNSLSANMLKGIARIISTFGDALRDDIFKEHVGRLSTRMIARNAKDRRPGALGYAEAMLIAYNAKNKYRLSMRKLYGKSSENDLEDETDEEEYEEMESSRRG